MNDKVIISGIAAYHKDLNKIFNALTKQGLKPVKVKSQRKLWQVKYV